MPLTGVLIKGDGIGPEIIEATVDVIHSTGARIEWDIQPAGLEAYKLYGTNIPQKTLNKIIDYGICLKGPFTTPSGGLQRSANWSIRRELDLYACIRPIVNKAKNINIIIVRENTEDLYGATEWMAMPGVAHAVKVTSVRGSERIIKYALNLCESEKRQKLTVVHKANNLKLTEGMFLEKAYQLASEYKHLEINDLLIDTAAYLLVSSPDQFEVIVTNNSYGDILTGVGAGVIGSLALIPSLNVNDKIILAEAAHGSAPLISGKNVANPMGMILAGAMLLDSLNYKLEAESIRKSVDSVIHQKKVTADLGGNLSLLEVKDEICRLCKENMSSITS